MAEESTVESIFYAALEKRLGDERDSFLRQACADDLHLRRRLELLLDAQPHLGRFLEDQTVSIAASQFGTVAIGTQLGPFTLLKQLGRGAMGVVYEAEQVSLGRRVALKILPFAALLNETQLERFNTEATAAARLQHSGIVTIYSVGCERGIHFLAMQLIEGPSLAQVIAELRQEPPAECNSAEDQPENADTVVAKKADVLTRDEDGGHYRAVAKVGREAAEALQYAHEHGVLHRDIKPSNLLLDNSGHVWIADFGLARVEDESQLTRTGDILGTLRYMSPEAATGDRVDARSDVYSLGATLYELATLQPVFDAEDRRDIIKQVIAGHPVAPHKIDSRIPKPLSLVISKAMARRLDERYQTAQELADDLQRFLDGEAVLARPPSPLRRATATLRRHPLITLSSIALVVACLYIPHRFGTNEPDNSSVTSSTDTGDPTMFRSAPKKRTSRKNERIRQLRHEQLEDRRLLAGEIEISIDDVTAIEGDETGMFLDVFAPDPPTPGQLDGPGGMVFDGEGNLYVASMVSDEILRYDEFGAVDVFVTAGSGGLDAPSPTGLLFGPDRNSDGKDDLYVASHDTHNVLCYDGNDGHFLVEFIPAGLGGLASPAGMVFGEDGHLYVSSAETDQVLRYDATGGFDGIFADTGSGGLAYPRGITFGPDGNSDGKDDVYVASAEADSIHRFDGTTGAFIDVFVPEGSGGLDYPGGLRFTPDNNLYVLSSHTNQTLRYNATTGAFLGVFIDALNGLSNPLDLVFHGDGKLYVSSWGTDEIVRYDSATGAFADVFVTGGESLQVPHDITTGPDGNVYVSSYFGGSVNRYDAETGAFIDIFVAPFSGGLDGTVGMDFGPDGNLYMSSWTQNRVAVFDGTHGTYIRDLDTLNEGGLEHPRGLTFGPDGNLYVASSRLRSVLRYDVSTGQFDRAFVTYESGGLIHPSGVTFGPDGNLYVSEGLGNRRVLRYHGTTGVFMDVFTSGGNPSSAQNLIFGPDGDLYVSSWGDDRVLRFDGMTGDYIADYVRSGDHGLSNPWGLLFDDENRLLVAGATNFQVMRYVPKSYAAFTVSLSEPSATTVTVYATADTGSAESGIDFVPINGTLTFDPGVTSMSIVVPTIDDTLSLEGEETFTVILSNPTGGATIPVGQETGTATIIDTDFAFENNISQPLKDGKNAARPGVTTSTIDVGGFSSILDLNVTVNISHTYVGQLSATLIAPDDTRVELFSNVGGGSDLGFAGTMFDDDAAASITTGAAPFTGTFQPVGSLAALDGIMESGDWKLEISDNAKGDTGTLNSWALDIAALPAGNTPPVAVDDSASTDVDTGVTVQVLDNDTDADNDDLSVADVTQPTNGTVVHNATSVTYTPNAAFVGNDTFTYTVSDGNGGTDTGTVSINVSDPSVQNAIYVYDIRFESKRGNKDWRAVFEIRVGDGGSSDTGAVGADVVVWFDGVRYEGTTDSEGIFRTSWHKDIGSGSFLAEVESLALMGYLEDLDLYYFVDEDGDGLPDRYLNRP